MTERINRVYNAPPTIKRFMLSEKRVRVLAGPLGSGKSVACVIEIIRRCQQQKKGPDGKRRSRWAVIRNTAPQLKDTTLKTWFDWVVPGAAGVWKESAKEFLLKFGDVEAEILFRPLDSPDDVSRVLSLELTGAWFNECREIPEEIVDAVQGRIKRYPSQANGGFTWSGIIADTNMPDEDSYWCEMMQNPPETWDVFIQPSALSPEAENLEHLAPDYYTELVVGKSKDWINVYVHSKFGRSMQHCPVYVDTYRKRLHVSKKRLHPVENELIAVGMDFGLNPAAIFGQIDPSFGKVSILRELTALNMTFERFLKTKFVPFVKTNYPDHPILIVGDPSAQYRSGLNGDTGFKMLKRNNFKVIPASTDNNIVDRIAAVDYWLTLLSDGEAAYQIDPRCKMLIEGFGVKYRYTRKKNGSTADKPDKGDHSHPHDANQYLCQFFKGGGTTIGKYMTPEPLPEQIAYTPNVW